MKKTYMKKNKLLFFQWASFMDKSIEKALKKLEITFDVFFYHFQDWEKDDYFCELLHDKLSSGRYDCVFSVNFAPLVSNMCEDFSVPYISWVYDSPIHIRNLDPMKNTCTHIYFFDRDQAEDYKRQGIAAEHLPLAADVERFQNAVRAKSNSGRMDLMDISMVGQLYQTDYAHYTAPLGDYVKGYLEGIIKSQMKIYGGYLISDLITENLLDKMNETYQSIAKDFHMEKRELEYMLACEATGRERFLALALLSAHMPASVYTDKEDKRLDKVKFCGYADYETVMPRVFAASRINLNISLKTIRSGIPLRVLDIAACGGFVLSNFQMELAEYFRIGEECEIYENLEDLLLKAQFYAAHEELRKKIAAAGLERVKRDFAFEDRMQKMLQICKMGEN